MDKEGLIDIQMSLHNAKNGGMAEEQKLGEEYKTKNNHLPLLQSIWKIIYKFVS